MSATIYGTQWCGWCQRAKTFLDDRGIPFTEIDIEATYPDDPRAKLAEIAGGRSSVPQIFIGDTHIGGFDDLVEADRNGRLADLVVAGA